MDTYSECRRRYMLIASRIFYGLLQLASPFIATRVNVSLIFAYSEITTFDG